MDFEHNNDAYEGVMSVRSAALKTANPSTYNKLLKLRVRTDNRPDYYKAAHAILQLLFPHISEQNNPIGYEVFQNLPFLTVNKAKLLKFYESFQILLCFKLSIRLF